MCKKGNAMVVADVFCKGVASTHLVALSMHVSTYRTGDVYTPSYVVVGGNGSVMSMWTVSNLPDGKGEWRGFCFSVPENLALLTLKTVRILLSMSGQKYFDFINLVVGVGPGCEIS